MMTGEQLGVGHEPRHGTAYVSSWIKALENDPREIRAAAVDAQRISDSLLARERERSRGDERAAPAPAETAGDTRAPGAPERSPRVGPDAPANCAGARREARTRAAGTGDGSGAGRCTSARHRT